MRVDSFTLSELDVVASKYSVSWAVLVSTPLRYAGAGQALFDLACQKCEVERRDLTATEALEVFEVVADDGLAVEFSDGVPDPKPEATP